MTGPLIIYFADPTCNCHMLAFELRFHAVIVPPILAVEKIAYVYALSIDTTALSAYTARARVLHVVSMISKLSVVR